MADNFILLNNPKETREFSSQVAVAFFENLEETSKEYKQTGSIDIESLSSIVGEKPAKCKIRTIKDALKLTRKKKKNPYALTLVSIYSKIATYAK